MTAPQQDRERREHKRFKVKERAFAVIQLGPYSTKLGQLLDISENGLAFAYMIGDKWDEDPAVLDILFGDDNFYLHDVPIQTVSDVPLNNEPAFASIRLRRRGVRFGDLTASQRSQLEYFILHNTEGEV